MRFAPGDTVHLAGLGTGTVLEARGATRYAVTIKGRVVVASADALQLVDARSSRAAERRRRGGSGSDSGPDAASLAALRGSARPPSIDLHGKTIVEAVEAVEAFINDALVAGHGEVRIIHGRGGGRVKGAVHRYLGQLSSVAAFRVDPHNPGLTLVVFA
jgi:DNA mismatch repair protein MutS2